VSQSSEASKPNIVIMNDPSYIFDLFGLSGKAAIVTGAAAGIGHGIARMLSAAGARVVVADLRSDACSSVARELSGTGAQAIAVPTDVRDKASVADLFAASRKAFGPIDVLINNAGIFPHEPFLDATAQDLDKMIAVNVRGVLFCTQEAVTAMRSGSKGGSIVNISSSASRRPVVYDNATYAASKAAVDSLTRTAAMEFASHGIRVNAVAPGGIRTEASIALQSSSTPLKGPITTPGRILLGRTGTPEDIASAVLFLASRASSYITGRVLLVDGGFDLS
jgi:NAD(P)-dependent dehydrogenase (short-subunit alcohol dehydrogenase family)